MIIGSKELAVDIPWWPAEHGRSEESVKLSATTIVYSLILSLAFWYVYWLSWGEAPSAQETGLLVGIAIALVIGAASLRARLRRAGDKKR